MPIILIMCDCVSEWVYDIEKKNDINYIYQFWVKKEEKAHWKLNWETKNVKKKKIYDKWLNR